MDIDARVTARAYEMMLTVQVPKTKEFPCSICVEQIPWEELVMLECRHLHCKGCLKANAQSTLQSSPFRPAKCCKVLSADLLARHNALNTQELTDYKNKVEELTNPSSKLYCHNADCSRYIPLANYKTRIGVCADCSARTCRACRAKSHFGPCDKEKLQVASTTEGLVLKLAEAKGWKRCPGCLSLIQKHSGCNHMMCSCGQGFCYACGQAIDSYSHHCGISEN